jgi:hypothetical protein
MTNVSLLLAGTLLLVATAACSDAQSGESAGGGPPSSHGAGGPRASGGGDPGSGGGPHHSSTSTGSAGHGAGSTGPYLTPNPLISRGKPVQGSTDSAANAFDGDYTTDQMWYGPGAGPNGSIDMWVKINVGKGPTKLLFVYHHTATPDYTITPNISSGAPTAYNIEVSPDGSDGSWQKVVEVAGDATSTTYRNRGHRFDFTGMSWVRWNITATSDNNVNISEIDIYDVSKGNEDTWLFAGSAETRFAYQGQVTPSWPTLVAGKHASYFPAMIDIADTGSHSDYLAQNIDTWILLNPDFHHWVLVYGLGDAFGDTMPDDQNFKSNMQTAIDKLKAAGLSPIIPHIEKPNADQFAHVADYDAVIDQLVADNQLEPGPDFYAWFAAHPEDYCGTSDCEAPAFAGNVPSDSGMVHMNALWADTVDPLYGP